MQLTVPAMSCQHCVETIRTALAALPEVDKVSIDLATKSVVVEGGVAATTVQLKLRDIHYPAQELPGPMDCV